MVHQKLINPELAIEAKGLTKSFGSQLALRGVDLLLRKGEFLTVFGPNGSGKTTLIKVLATILKPSSGSLWIAGLDFKKGLNEIRRQIGLVTHQTFLYDELTAYENLKFYGRMFDIKGLEERIEEVADKVGLKPYLYRRVRTLSRGMQQRLSIARAIIHCPQILFLDEPETGLDQEAISLLGEILKSFTSEGGAVVMTTHNLEYGLGFGDKVMVLARGRVVYEGAKGSLDRAGFKEMYLQLTGVSG